MLIFSKDPQQTIRETVNQASNSHPMSTEHSSSSEFFRVPCQHDSVCDDGIPSMSILLSTGMRNQVGLYFFS